MQKMIQESFNGKEERFAELVVLPSTHTGHRLPMNWEAELCVRRDVEEHSASL